MFSFSDALGVNCIHCPVAGDRNDWSTYDFASNEKQHKRSARIMMHMVSAINRDHLSQLGFGYGFTTQVGCRTCHHGQDRPLTVAQRLWNAIESGGVQAGLAEYHQLREHTFGRGVFDFGEGSLNALGYRLLLADRLADAIAVFELNVQVNPEKFNPYDSLAEAYMKAGKRDKAVVSYRRSLDLNPHNLNAVEMLKGLGALE